MALPTTNHIHTLKMTQEVNCESSRENLKIIINLVNSFHMVFHLVIFISSFLNLDLDTFLLKILKENIRRNSTLVELNIYVTFSSNVYFGLP